MLWKVHVVHRGLETHNLEKLCDKPGDIVVQSRVRQNLIGVPDTLEKMKFQTFLIQTDSQSKN